MEQILVAFFAAVNRNDVDGALECCANDVKCTYPDAGRNWQGKAKGRTVMTAIFGQLARIQKEAVFEIITADPENRVVETKESWGHAKITTKTVYTFTEDYKISSMAS